MTPGPRERNTIERWAGEQHRPLTMVLSATGHPDTETLRAFCRELGETCALLTISEIAGDDDQRPALVLRQGSISYRAVPAGTELEPFLDALAGDGETGGIHRPASLQLHVAAACPHCPGVVRSLLPLIPTGGPLTLEVIDSTICSDLAKAQRIKSVPTLILDQAFRWTGQMPLADLEALLAPGNRSHLGARTLERLLEGGNAGALARLMTDAGKVNPGLGRLLAAETMSVRLGAMMVVEELLEEVPGLVTELIPTLEAAFAGAPEPAQGDILYIFGEAGSPGMKKKIESLLETDLHSEVAEAAREALERLGERQK